MGFFDVEDIPKKKIIVPIPDVNTEHLKKLFSNYHKKPTLAQIKTACLLDGRSKREVARMKQMKLKNFLWNKNKMEEIKEDINEITKEQEPEEPEEPVWEGYDMEDSKDQDDEKEED